MPLDEISLGLSLETKRLDGMNVSLMSVYMLQLQLLTETTCLVWVIEINLHCVILEWERPPLEVLVFFENKLFESGELKPLYRTLVGKSLFWKENTKILNLSSISQEASQNVQIASWNIEISTQGVLSPRNRCLL